MGDVIKFTTPSDDLVKPEWFYFCCEKIMEEVMQGFGPLLEACPFGEIVECQVYEAAARTPVSLMQQIGHDFEIETFVIKAALSEAIFEQMAKGMGRSIN